jgi:alkylhydroperoxidase family enzyme
VRDQAWTITDEDIGALQVAGYSEDAILELTVAAAAGAAGRRYDAALRALRGDG